MLSIYAPISMGMTVSSHSQRSVLLNNFLIFANMIYMASHNSLICMCLISSEVKRIFMCLSAFVFSVS